MGIAIEGLGSDILVLGNHNTDALNGEPFVYVVEAAFSLIPDSTFELLRDRVVFVNMLGDGESYKVKFYTETESLSVIVDFETEETYSSLALVYYESRVPTGLRDYVTYDYGMPNSLREYLYPDTWRGVEMNIVPIYSDHLFICLLSKFSYDVPLRDIVRFDTVLGDDGVNYYSTFTDSDGRSIVVEYHIESNFLLYITDVIYN